MRIRRRRTIVLLTLLAGCEASSGWQTPSFPTSLDDVRSIRRATDSSLGVDSTMRADDGPFGGVRVMTPAERRMAVDARLEQLEAELSQVMDSYGSGAAMLADGSPVPSGAAGEADGGSAAAGSDTAGDGAGDGSAAGAPATLFETVRQQNEAIAELRRQLEELPAAGSESLPDALSPIEERLDEQTAKLNDLGLEQLDIKDELASKFGELAKRVEGREAGAAGAAPAFVAGSGATAGSDRRWRTWLPFAALPLAAIMAWAFSRTGRSRASVDVEHVERRIDDVDERQARLEERQREALPLGKRGAYLAGAGAVAGLRKSDDPVDQEAADFFEDAGEAPRDVAEEEAAEFFGTTTEAAGEAEFTITPPPAPEAPERFARTQEDFGGDSGVPAPEAQWSGAGAEESLEARLARGIQERYFAEGGAAPAAGGLTSGSIDWDEATRRQAEERAQMTGLDEPLAERGGDASSTDPPWAPLTSEAERLEHEEAGWSSLAGEAADEAARYREGALDEEEHRADDEESDLV